MPLEFPSQEKDDGWNPKVTRGLTTSPPCLGDEGMQSSRHKEEPDCKIENHT